MEFQIRDISPEDSCNKFNEFCKNIESGNFAIVMYQKSPTLQQGL
jgi:hypothetical protein